VVRIGYFQLPLSGSPETAYSREAAAATTLSTPSLGITPEKSSELKHQPKSFNSLSRDHSLGKGGLPRRLRHLPITNFQLPLSGSLAAGSTSCPSRRTTLSTPSLGITELCDLTELHHQLRFQLPLSGSHHRRLTRSSAKEQILRTFNSLSRDHRRDPAAGARRAERQHCLSTPSLGITCKQGSRGGTSARFFQLPLSGSREERIYDKFHYRLYSAFNSLSRDH